MNFKPELLAKVLDREKTQTRRPVKPGQHPGVITDASLEFIPVGNGYGDILNVHTLAGRMVYEVGKDYAACPGRGKHQQGRIRILDIREEDVRTICSEDVIAEGFQDVLEFFKVWCGFYDPLAYKFLCAVNDPLRVDDLLSDRPDHLYQAWALTFELVNRTQPPSLRGFVAEQAPAIADLFR